MIVIVCLDDRGGMMFNNRRQSMDSKVRENIICNCKGNRLWMNEYSYRQFENDNYSEIKVSDNFLKKAKKKEFCFVENESLLQYEEKIEKIIAYKWNRAYPYDFSFDISLDQNIWKCTEINEFKGNSHEKITMEVYER